MYFGALIQLPDGTRKAIERNGLGPLAAIKFMGALGDYAKKENKLLKVCCDDFKTIAFLQKAIGCAQTKVEYGIEGMMELELNEP